MGQILSKPVSMRGKVFNETTKLTFLESTVLGAGIEKNQRALLHFVNYIFIKIKYTYRKVYFYVYLEFSQTH